MWKTIICRHLDVQWLDSHRCSCNRCGKFGHWFEDGYVIWTRAAGRPLEADDAEVHEFERALATATVPGVAALTKLAG